MRKLILMLSSAAFAGGALAVNPIITHKYSADPNAFVWNDRLYVMCSHDTTGQDGFEMHDYILLSTDDLVNWTDHGDVFRGGKDVSWCWNLYAPGVAVKNGKVYLYYPNSGGPIGVAVADRPEGPYTDPLGKPLISYEMPGCDSAWVFDPAAFVDDDGQGYLYFGGNGGTMARGIRLNGDMTSAQFPAVTLTARKDGVDTEMPSFFEASYMHKHNGKYYFSYSANFPDRGASIDYAMGDSPLGPFEWKGAMLPNFNDNMWNNNHQSVVEFGGKSYIFYHSRLLTMRNGSNKVNERSVGIDELTYNADGTIVPVTPTHEGPAQLKTLDPLAYHRAVTICEDHDITVTMAGNATDRLSVVTALGDGAWLRYAGFKATSNKKNKAPAYLTVRCRAYDDATLEVHKNSVDGEILTTISLYDTDGKFVKFTGGRIPNFGTAKMDLYFVFKGKARGVEFADYMFSTGTTTNFGSVPAIDNADVVLGLGEYKKGFGLVEAIAQAPKGDASIGPFRSAEGFYSVGGWNGDNSTDAKPNRRDYNLDAWAPDAIYQQTRWSDGITVTIPNLTPGAEYVVEWHTAEFYYGEATRAFKLTANGSEADFYADTVASGVEFTDGKMVPLRPYALHGRATADAEGKIVLQASANGNDNPAFSGIAVWGASAPTKPSEFAVTRESGNLDVSWTKVPNTLRYYLECAPTDAESWSAVASAFGDAQSLSVAADPTEALRYRLVASNGVDVAISDSVRIDPAVAPVNPENPSDPTEPTTGLWMKTFDFGDAGVCAANFIENRLDWNGATQVSGFSAVNTTEGWSVGKMIAYKGYLWNKGEEDVVWTFIENFDDAVRLYIDGNLILENAECSNTIRVKVTLTPGAHRFEARFANYSGEGGPSASSWQGWSGCPKTGFAVYHQAEDNLWYGGFDTMESPDFFTRDNPGEAAEPTPRRRP